jgi:branched-chain amino acid transport system permease protein
MSGIGSLVVHLAILVCIYAILALSLNLIMGVTGLFSLAQAAFYGIGAYTSALLAFQGVPWIVCLISGMLMAAFVAFVIGLPTLRLAGDYLAVVTLGLGEISRAVMKNWTSVTRGTRGLPGIPHASLFGYTFVKPEQYLVLAVVILILVYIVCERLLRSPFGRVLMSIREDETAVQALGKDTFRFKMWAMVIGCGIAGLAGSLFAHYISFIDPSSFVMWQTFFTFLIIVLGGLGNNLGAVVATAVFVTVREGLRFVDLPQGIDPAALQQLGFGLLLIAITLFRPRGLFPERRHSYRRYFPDAKG